MRAPPYPPTPAEANELRRCACLNLRQATRAVTQLYDDMLRPSGLRITQFSLLTVIRLTGGASIGTLADAAVMDRTTLTRNLKLLADVKLIRIEEGDDARVRLVTLTREGEARLAAAQPHWEDAQKRMTKSLGRPELDRLLQGLSAAIAAGQAR
jgi:DNA-binding MarR family transcriptional regulator